MFGDRCWCLPLDVANFPRPARELGIGMLSDAGALCAGVGVLLSGVAAVLNAMRQGRRRGEAEEPPEAEGGTESDDRASD